MTIAITRWGNLWRTVAVLAVVGAFLAGVDALKVHDLGLMWIAGAVAGVAATQAGIGLLVKLTGHPIHTELAPPAPPAL